MSLSLDQQVTFLYVKDLERSERFYGEILGLELVLNQGLARIYRVGSGNAFLGICLSSAVQQAPPPDRAPLGVIVTFVTNDVDGTDRHSVPKGWHSRRHRRSTQPTTFTTASFAIQTATCLRSRNSFHPTGHASRRADAVVGPASNCHPGAIIDLIAFSHQQRTCSAP